MLLERSSIKDNVVIAKSKQVLVAVFELKVWEKVEWMAGIEMQVSKAINKIVSLKYSVCWGWWIYFPGS